MIANWSFESPQSLVSPGLPLALDTPEPFFMYLSFNHALISLSEDNKGSIPASSTAHDHEVVTTLVIYPSKGRKCHHKITLKQIAFQNFEHLMKNLNIPAKWQKNWMETRSSPHTLLCSKWWAGWYSNNCIISMQGFVWVVSFKQQQKRCVISSPNCGWMILSKGLGKSQVTSTLLTEARVSFVSMYVWSRSFADGYLQQLLYLGH